LGQIEVYELLKNRRLTGDHNFMSVPEIIKAIKEHKLHSQNPRGIWAAVCTLEAYGYLDVKKQGKLRDFKRVVRLKKKYLK